MTAAVLPVVVVGSGPAGVAAARALLAHGRPVTMVDTGVDMPATALAVREQLAVTEPAAWDRAELQRLNRLDLRQRGQVPLKTVFGSDYPYNFDPDVTEDGVTLLGSQARGGLSNVWGAALLPLSVRDMAGWPLAPAALAPHYAAVLRWLPHAQHPDGLSAEYPLHSAEHRPLQLSAQARALLADLHGAQVALNTVGVCFGQARLAVSECIYCGQCLHGCPYQRIYSSAQSLQELQQHPDFNYLDRTQVRALEERADRVVLHTGRTDEHAQIHARRVLLGAGVLPTAQLLLPLLGIAELQLRDSAYRLLPFLRYRRARQVAAGPHYTLAQLFMEMDVPEVSVRNVHLQWYGYNDFYAAELDAKLGPLAGMVPAALRQPLLERLWTLQLFLHSDDSPGIRLQRDAGGRIHLSALPEPRSEQVFAAVSRKLSKLAPQLGGRALNFAARRSLPGGSFHVGASLPMAARPQGLQSDTAGRPAGLQRIHVIDASVLPNIASSTITFSVMANAHRIASDCARFD